MNATFWYPFAFPNSDHEDCVIARLSPERSFDDISCGYPQPYICEREFFHDAILCHPDDSQYRTVRLPDGESFTYRFVHTPMTARMAKADCVKSGGSLVKVSTISKKDFIYQILNCPAFKCHPNDGQYRTVRLSDGKLFTYRFGTSRLTADMAQADCERTGGSLADISTVQKLDFVSQVMGCANIGIRPYFIGGRRDNTLTWRWSDGDPIAMNSTYWQPGFPNTNNEDCMFLRVNPTRSFDDYDCGSPLPYFLCEKKILPTAISCSTDDAQYHTVQLSDGDAFTYRIVHTMMTADLAQADCKKDGGSLAKLSTVPKLDIASQLIDCSKQNPLYGYFVDGRKENVTQPWKWSDGEVIPMNSTFWYPIFPNSQDEDCVIIRKIGLPSRSFDDIKCGYSQPYICERKVFHAAFLCHPDDGQYRTVRLPDGDLFTYRFVHTPMTAKMAQEDCVNTGGSLVKVSTVSKKDFIHQIMNCPGFEQRFHYVDGSNNYADLTWKWSDGQKIPMNNTFWISKYPDAPNVDHCLIISRNEWTFDDINCSTILPFICEKPSV